VDIRIRSPGYLKVDDVVYGRDIETASGDVRRKEDRVRRFGEPRSQKEE